MGAVPSANYYESDIDLYAATNGITAGKLAQRHSYYENNKINTNANNTSQIAQRLKSSVPNISYSSFSETLSNTKKQPHIKKKKKLNRFFTFRQKSENKNFLKSKSTHNFLSKSMPNDQNEEHVVVNQTSSSLLDPSKHLMDESLGLVTSRSGSMSLLSSSYSIKSRISSHLNKASTPNDAIEIDKVLLNGKEIETNTKINTSCSSGCSSAASSSNLSRNSRLSHSNRQQDSPLSSISAGYQSSSGNKQLNKIEKDTSSSQCKAMVESKKENRAFKKDLVEQQISKSVFPLAANTEYDLFNINYLHSTQFNNFNLIHNNNQYAHRESPTKSNKNSLSSTILNKLGIYLKSSSKLNEKEVEDHANESLSSTDKSHQRSVNRRGSENRIKSKSMFVESASSTDKQLDTELVTFPSPMRQSTNKVRSLKKRFSLKLKKSKKTSDNSNDSGILTDLFNKGSMSNIKQRLNNATSVLRQSFSVFSLKQNTHVKTNGTKNSAEIAKMQGDKQLELFRCKSQLIESGDDIEGDEEEEEEEDGESEMSSDVDNYGEIETEEKATFNQEDLTDFDFNKSEEFSAMCTSNNINRFTYNANPESILSNRKNVTSCLRNGDILKHQHQNKLILNCDLEKSEIDALSSNSISELKKLNKNKNLTQNRKNSLTEKSKHVSNDDAPTNNAKSNKEISKELAACYAEETTSKTFENNCFERNKILLNVSKNNNNNKNQVLKSSLDYSSPNFLTDRRSSLISSSSSGSSSGVTRSSLSSSSENSSDYYSSINQFQSKLNKFRNNFEMSKNNEQHHLVENQRQQRNQFCNETKFASLRRTSTFHTTLANPFNTLITPRPSAIPKIVGNEYGSMANLIEERLIEKRRQYLLNHSNTLDASSCENETARLMQAINTNQEINAYNNNTKYSVNALINSSKLPQGQNDKNNFVNNFKSTNNHSSKMSEILRPILTQRNPSFSAKLSGNSKLVNSKTSVSLMRNESFTRPPQNNLESSFNSFSSSSMKIIPNPAHMSCQKSSRILSSIQQQTTKAALINKTNECSNTKTINTQSSHKHQKIVVQASTSDLLRCFASFISQRCSQLFKDVNKIRQRFDPRETISWLRIADRALLLQGWQDVAFLNPVNVIFFYMMVRDSLKPSELRTIYDLQCNIMACLYLAFSYMGNEISYPLKPFLIEVNRDLFWQRTIMLMNKLSGNMLRINQDPKFFTELFYELKSYSVHENSQYSIVSNPKADMSLSLNHAPPPTTTFKSFHCSKSLNSTSTISLSDLNNKNSKFEKMKENQNVNYSSNYHTLLKPISSSQLLFNKTSKINQNSSNQRFFATIKKPEALYEPDLSRLENASSSKIKQETFNFLGNKDQFVMYGGANDEQSMTYCI